jgi:hypothetical protein
MPTDKLISISISPTMITIATVVVIVIGLFWFFQSGKK